MLDVLDNSYEVFASRLGHPSGLRRQPPRFESMAMLSAGLSHRFGALLDGLLAGCRDPGLGGTALRPLWAEEAMHRAFNMVRLVAARNRCEGPADRTPAEAEAELRVARDLASLFRSLDNANETQIVPCDGILREVVRDMETLFGTVAGEAISCTDIEQIALPAGQRRALILASVELIVSALLRASDGRGRARIEVALVSVGPGRARLSVTDDGAGFAHETPDPEGGILAELVDLLGAELRCHRTGGRTTTAIVFSSGMDARSASPAAACAG